MSVSVHDCAFGQHGLGSPATQLMRAVSHSLRWWCSMIEIRNEQSGDQDDVRRVNLAAFENGPEATVVDKLRQSGTSYHSFVAVEHGEIVGHILFTPVALDGREVVGAGLAPLAVSPTSGRQVQSALLVESPLFSPT